MNKQQRSKIAQAHLNPIDGTEMASSVASRSVGIVADRFFKRLFGFILTIIFVVALVGFFGCQIHLENRRAEERAAQAQQAKEAHPSIWNTEDNQGSGLDTATLSEAKEAELIEKGRKRMSNVEHAANEELQDVLTLYYPDRRVFNSKISYDLPDESDFTYPGLISWIQDDGLPGLIQSGDFPVESTMDIFFPYDKVIADFSTEELEDILGHVGNRGLIAHGQKCLILLKGASIQRQFECEWFDGGDLAVKERRL